jgi:type IV pilus assembly protein PilN
MIKINLVGERKRPVTPSPAAGAGGFEGASIGNWLLIGLIVLGILFALGHMWYLNGKIEDKEVEVAEAQREVDELEPYIREVEAFKAKKAELERKVEVINQLKANQHGPVRVMDYVSRALPELLWLNRMEVAPTTITLTGQAFNTNAVANFIENLDRVPEFQEPILRDTQQKGEIYTFVIAFNYSFKAPAPEAEEAAVVTGG